MSDPLDSIIYISLPEEVERSIGSFQIDPSRMLPVDTSGGNERYDIADLTWEQILAGMLKVLAHQPNHEDADYYRRFVLALRPDVVDELGQTGVAKARNRDFALAEEIFKALRALEPDAERHLINLALLAEDHAQLTSDETERQRRLEQAFGYYTEILSGDNPSADSHLNAGYFFLRRQNFERARHHLDTFLQLSDDQERIDEVSKVVDEIDAHNLVDTLFKEAYDFIRLGREEDGVARAREFLQKSPKVWNGWFLLGWGLRRLGAYAEASEAFERALELGPRQPDTLNELAICRLELEDVDAAERYLSEALRSEPENTKVMSNLGIVAMKRDDPREAAAYFRAVLEIDPDDRIAQQFLEQL